MELRIGDPVTTIGGGVDLCTGPDLYRSIAVLERDQLGIVLETYDQPVTHSPHQIVRYAKVLSPSGISGWCVSRFLIKYLPGPNRA